VKNSGTKLLETERLILRKFKKEDAREVFENWASDIDSARYNAWTVHSSIDVTESYLSE